MKTALFDYDLPKRFIAQHPAAQRDRSRLMVLDRASGAIEHRVFADLPEYLGGGDALVVNDTRVVPARLIGTRASGGAVEVLLVRQVDGDMYRKPSHREGAIRVPGRKWEAMIQCRGRLREGEAVTFSEGLSATILARGENGASRVELRSHGDLAAALARVGRAPLPPYIKRPKGHDADAGEDAERYQTVYAAAPGAIAAPTAGLHFTPELLAEIEGRGCVVTAITLHVGPGTFKPVRAETVEEHTVDPERYAVTRAAAETVNRARRVVAVGTTACRVLETLARRQTEVSASPKQIESGEGWTNLFIHPPHKFRVVDALVTNFHLPRSSLLMLVSAFAGRDRILAAYEEAKREGYRFYSYGDAMLIV